MDRYAALAAKFAVEAREEVVVFAAQVGYAGKGAAKLARAEDLEEALFPEVALAA